jgi:hypothetical protein
MYPAEQNPTLPDWPGGASLQQISDDRNCAATGERLRSVKKHLVDLGGEGGVNVSNTAF